MPRKRGERFYTDPVDAESLRDLLSYYFQSGVGLPVSADGISDQWTDVKLEAALAEVGIDVDRRSIQSWLSGASIPKADKLKGLASLASADRYEREKWTAAFLRLRRKALDARKQDRRKTGAPESAADTASQGRDDRPFRAKWASLALAAALVLTAVTSAVWLFAGGTGSVTEAGGSTAPVARNIYFCSEADFSRETRQCETVTRQFPDGLTTLMVTFDLVGVAEGETFTRKWYHNGRKIHEKTSHKDDAWPGYTYWHWPEGFDTGEYALQIVSGDRAVTRTFQVGEDQGDLNSR